jgi:DNA-binding GntR family transcriptional regulator
MPTAASAQVLAPIQRRSLTLADATRATLQQAILAGKFAPGSQLPPEVDLMTEIGVSRTTLREALKRLEEQGLIARRRGRGTYVRERSSVKDLSLNFGIAEMIIQSGWSLGVRSVNISRQPASPEAAAALALPGGAPLVVVDRVHTADDRPVVWSRDVLGADRLGPHVLAADDLQRSRLYEWLGEVVGIRVTHGKAQVAPATATPELATQLSVATGTPLLRMAQTDFDAGDQPVLYSVEFHLPDAFVFVVNRRGPYW